MPSQLQAPLPVQSDAALTQERRILQHCVQPSLFCIAENTPLYKVPKHLRLRYPQPRPLALHP